MAGDWIKVESSTPDKPEVVQMAQQLKMDQDAVFGKLMRLWIWADQQTISGNARGVTKTWIDRYTFCAGFSDAMQSAGWLIEKNGEIEFPNFDRHNGQTAKSRALTAKRVQKLRNAPSVTSALPEKRREEKRRRENTTPHSPPGGEMFITWYQNYPRRTGKEHARRAFLKALERIRKNRSCTTAEAAAWLLRQTEVFAQSPRGRSGTAWLPATWLNGGHYDDDPAEWERIPTNSQQQQPSQQPSRAEQRQAEMLEQERRMLRR